MRLSIAGLLAASALVIAVPASAQGIYVGPRGGVGVDIGGVGIGASPSYDRGYDRDGYAEPYYEGRSVYSEPYTNNYDTEDDF